MQQQGTKRAFQLAEVAVPRALFAEILRRIDRLRPEPPRHELGAATRARAAEVCS
jgi:hypothetical protein